MIFREIIDIALSQKYDDERWFKDANERYKKLQAKRTQSLDDNSLKEKQQILDELKEELKKLDEGKNLGLRLFIDFLFKNFPPKHRKKAVKPIVFVGKEKKVCTALSALYHPDKIKEEHGQKYKVLCEEIVKRINQRLANYKGVD